jgi:hypothetical protein
MVAFSSTHVGDTVSTCVIAGACRKRRARKEASRAPPMEQVLSRWVVDRNTVLNRPLPHALNKYNATEQCFFMCDCDRHMRYVLLKTVAADPVKAFQCVICDGGHKSKLEAHIWWLLDNPGRWMKQPNPNLVWLVEVRVLKGHWAPADIWLPDHNLVIQVDGSQHFSNPMGHRDASPDPEPASELPDPTSEEEATPASNRKPQEKKDWEFNQEAARQGVHVLRIHTGDVAMGHVVLHLALEELSRAKAYGGRQPLRILSRAMPFPEWQPDEEKEPDLKDNGLAIVRVL